MPAWQNDLQSQIIKNFYRAFNFQGGEDFLVWPILPLPKVQPQPQPQPAPEPEPYPVPLPIPAAA